jgi:hypothetical protein
MTTGSTGDDYLADIPGELVIRAQQDMDYAIRLLDSERRQEAIAEAELSLSEEQQAKLNNALDSIAQMSFQDVLQALKDLSVTRMV